MATPQFDLIICNGHVLLPGSAAPAMLDVAIDYVSTTRTLEQAIAALGIGGRMVTLGGSGKTFTASSSALLSREQEILGSRYASRQQVIEALDLCARGEVWPLVTEKVPFTEAEAVHQRLETGSITGRAALMMGG